MSEERIVRGSLTFNDNVANTDISTPRLCLMPSVTFEDGTSRLSQNIGKKLPFYAA